MEVYDLQLGRVVQNVTSVQPTFVVDGLNEGASLDIALYAWNRKGASSSQRLQASVPKSAGSGPGK